MKHHTDVGCYDHRTQFSPPPRQNKGGFGSESKRFGQLGVGNSDPRNWSPYGPSYYGANKLPTMGRTEPGAQAYRDLKNKSTAATFGVGRGDMKKLYIDEIMQNKNNTGINPGAGTYEPAPTFGSSNKYNVGFSMRKQLYMDDKKYEKAKKLPGPGQYSHPERVGQAQLNDSRAANASKYSFGIAEDRFRTGKFNVPAPDSYDP